MAKTENITMTGKVLEALKGAKFLVEVTNNENSLNIIGSVSGRMRQNNITIAVGDAVDIEVSPYDLKIGRITRRK